jgi:lantibiotic modifying enzyme
VQAPDEEDDVLFDVDERLLEQLLCAGASDLQYDLISGVVGTGIYWLERLPHQKALYGIKQVLGYLDHTSQSIDTGVTWFTPPPLIHASQKHWAPHGYHNLGVAHGVPGVISFLAQVASIPNNCETNQRASKLLSASVDWLLRQRRPSNCLSRYSSWQIPNETGDDSRLAWCYGDLGIAAVLYLAGERMGEVSWQSEAIDMAYECASRKADRHVIDAQLCHGALGIAHIFHRFYNATRDEIFGEATLEWARTGMAFRKASTGIAGYFTCDPDSTDRPLANVSFLSGVVGIALCLLSIVSPHEPKWDRLILLSAR